MVDVSSARGKELVPMFGVPDRVGLVVLQVLGREGACAASFPTLTRFAFLFLHLPLFRLRFDLLYRQE